MINLFTYLNVVQIIVSVVLMVVVLLQTKGEGFSGTFSSDTSVFRTRRGVEKTLFQFTIALGVIFVVVSIVSVLAGKTVPTV
ncbi:MAG: preprotein translocase subunit SecG [Dehalococcoidales bacterium]|nr:preprotein translocase subunit SecG [Dehalococcoidales bacterium]